MYVLGTSGSTIRDRFLETVLILHTIDTKLQQYGCNPSSMFLKVYSHLLYNIDGSLEYLFYNTKQFLFILGLNCYFTFIIY